MIELVIASKIGKVDEYREPLQLPVKIFHWRIFLSRRRSKKREQLFVKMP